MSSRLIIFSLILITILLPSKSISSPVLRLSIDIGSLASFNEHFATIPDRIRHIDNDYDGLQSAMVLVDKRSNLDYIVRPII